MHGEFGPFSPGKASSHSARNPPCFFLLCAVFSWFHTTGCEAYSFTTDGYGIFNVRTNVRACRRHEGGSGTNRYIICTRVDSEGQQNCPSPCPTRGSNPGPSDLNSDSLTPGNLRQPWSSSHQGGGTFIETRSDHYKGNTVSLVFFFFSFFEPQ